MPCNEDTYRIPYENPFEVDNAKLAARLLCIRLRREIDSGNQLTRQELQWYLDHRKIDRSRSFDKESYDAEIARIELMLAQMP